MRICIIAVALMASVAAWPAQAGGPPGPAQDRVYGSSWVPAGSCTSGADVFCTQRDRELNILAVSSPTGGGAYGTVTFGAPDTGVTIGSARVTCLAVHGTTAVVSGVVTDYIDPAVVGFAYRVFIRDTGTPGSLERDGISANFFDDSVDPETCDTLDTGALGSGYFVVTHGDFAVEDH
jgi:hypothetical protein